MSLVDLVRLLTPVARALERAHHFPDGAREVAILHRDLKPENIFIARLHGAQVVKILDFGIGKAKNAATQIVGKLSANEDALSAFTPGYGAPEQWLPKRFGQTGPWTDVWGLSLTLVEACCGKSRVHGRSRRDPRGCRRRNAGGPRPARSESWFERRSRRFFARRWPWIPRTATRASKLFGARWRALSGPRDRMDAARVSCRRDPRCSGARARRKAGLGASSGPRPSAKPEAQRAHQDAPAHSPGSLAFGEQCSTTTTISSSDTRLPATASRRSPIALEDVGSHRRRPRRAHSVARTVAADRLGTLGGGTYRAQAQAADKVDLRRVRGDGRGLRLHGGERRCLRLGPVRAFWIAAPLVIGGVGLALMRLFASDE